ncbi:MAG: hypothetical protein O7H41_03405 [Planctomycetota bacterium]|nr:hypothetical protein [Planctomycetota bacterium]
MLVLGGLGLLLLGHKQEWFLAALETGALHNQTYFLAWGLVGLAYSLLASFMWLRWARQPGRVRRVLELFFLVALMMAGSQVAARRIMHPLWVKFVNMSWDPVSQEFVVDLASPIAAVAESHIRGDFQAIVSVEGLWWSSSRQESPQPVVESEVEEFAVGAPDLLGHRQEVPIAAFHWFGGTPWQVETIRLPWKPKRFGSHRAFVVRVNAALVNRGGKRVGGESSYYITREAYPPRGLDFADPLEPRMDAFKTEGWAWISDPDRNRAPFRVRPPPPPGVVIIREDVRVNPRK